MATFNVSHAQKATDGSSSPDWQKQYLKLCKELKSNPNDIGTQYHLAQFYADTNNSMRNITLAMKYISQAETSYTAALQDKKRYRETIRLIRRHITLSVIREERRSITNTMFHELSTDSTRYSEAQLRDIVNTFANETAIKRQVDRKRLQQSLLHTLQTGSTDAYHQFIQNYRGTEAALVCGNELGLMMERQLISAQTPQQVDNIAGAYADVENVERAIKKRKASLAYEDARRQGSAEAYLQFLKFYPYANEYINALDAYDSLRLMESRKVSTARELADLALHSNNVAIVNDAMRRLRSMIIDGHNTEAARIYINEFPLDEQHNSIMREVYAWHTSEGNSAPLLRFRQDYPSFPYTVALEEDLREAARIDKINLLTPPQNTSFRANANMVYIRTGKDISYVAMVRLLQSLIASKSWNAVLNRIEFFDLCFESYCTTQYNDLINLIKTPTDKRKTVSSEVSPNYDIQDAMLTEDGHTLYYTHVSSEGHTTIQTAHSVTGKKYKWKSNGMLSLSGMDNNQLRFYSLFDHDEGMLVGKEGRVFMFHRNENNTWELSDSLPSVNQGLYTVDAHMVPDGSGMLVASDRIGGLNCQPSNSYFHGDTALATDIYLIPLTEKGWGEAINLGVNINSIYSERCPAISDDMMTLYFISDGRAGLGYGDIYFSQRTSKDDWTAWSPAVNYGKEVNSGFREQSISIHHASGRLLFCSNRQGHYALYSTPLLYGDKQAEKNIRISSPTLSTQLEVWDLNTQRMIKELHLSPYSPTANIQCNESQLYLIYPTDYNRKKYFIPSIVVVPQDVQIDSILKTSFIAIDAESLQQQSVEMMLPAVLFNSNYQQFSALGSKELLNIASCLRENNHINIELSLSLTDTKTSTTDFQRAIQLCTEIKDKLIELGVDKERIGCSPQNSKSTKKNGTTEVYVTFFSNNNY